MRLIAVNTKKATREGGLFTLRQCPSGESLPDAFSLLEPIGTIDFPAFVDAVCQDFGMVLESKKFAGGPVGKP